MNKNEWKPWKNPSRLERVRQYLGVHEGARIIVLLVVGVIVSIPVGIGVSYLAKWIS